MIDSFPFESWYAGDAFNPELGGYWAYSGDPGGAYDSTTASTGTWVITIIAMATVLLAFIGWFRFEGQRIAEATERIRKSGRWSKADGVTGPPPPHSEVSR